METPKEFVIAHAPWSMSKADCAAQCPRKFALTYVEKAAKGEKLNADALVGQAAHKILELLLQGVPSEKAIDTALKYYSLTSVEIERINDLTPYILNFLTKFKHWCDKVKVSKYEVEKKLAIDLEGAPVTYWDKRAFFRGALDLLAFMSEHSHVAILDHKTGKPRDAKYHEKQFNSYLLLVKAHFPEITGAITGINYLQIDQVNMHPLRKDLELSELRDTVIRYLNDSTKNTASAAPNPSFLCGWCDYKLTCDAAAVARTHVEEGQNS